MKLEVTTETSEQTELLAQTIGKKLRGGEVIELIGDVGAGKTTFVRGLLAGLDSDDHVSSPTFTISNSYLNGRLPVHHFDFYRLSGDDQMIKHELSETVEEVDAVTILEWADTVQAVLPSDHLQIEITAPDELSRTFKFTVPEAYNYIGQS